MTLQQFGDAARRCLTPSNVFRVVYANPETYGAIIGRTPEAGFHHIFIDGNPADVVCDPNIPHDTVVPAAVVHH